MRPVVALVLLVLFAGCRTAAPPEPLRPVELPEHTPVEAPIAAEVVVDVAEKPPPPPNVPPGVYESRSYYPRVDLTEWRLSNGVRVGFKPTTAAPRRVQLLISTPGGVRAVPDSLAAALLSEAGALDEVRLAVGAAAGSLAVEVGTAALEDGVARLTTALADLPSANRAPLGLDDAMTLLFEGRPFALGGTPAGNGRQYHRLFLDPRTLLVVVVGDAAPSEVERTAAAFARLRPSFRALVEEDRPVPAPRIPARPAEVTLRRPGADAFGIGFRGLAAGDFDTRAALEVLGERLATVVARRLDSPVRVTTALDPPSGVAELRLVAEDPDVDAEAFRAVVLDEAATLRARTVGDADLARTRSAARDAHRAHLATNEGWAAWLTQILRFDLDPREAGAFDRRLSGVTAARVRSVAQAVLDADRYVFVVQTAD